MAAQLNPPLCGICFSNNEPNNNNYKLLPCGHSFCESCLTNLLLLQSDGTYVLGCPTCQHPVTLPSDGTIGLPNIEREEEENEGEDGIIIKKTQDPICSRHNKKIQLFCETCEQVTCHMCAIEDHQEHQYYILTRNIDKHKKELINGLEGAKTTRETCLSSLNKIKKREDEIEEHCASIKEEISSLTERLIQLIHTSQSQLLDEVDKIKTQKLQTLSHQKKEGELALEGINKCCESLEETLAITSPQTFLSNKKIMNEMILKYTSIKFAQFEPLEKADMTFKGIGSLLIHNKTMGQIQHSYLSQYCTLARATPTTTPTTTPTNQNIIRNGTTTILELHLQDSDGTHISPSPSLFTCMLIPQNEVTPISCHIEEIRPGVMGLHVTPNQDGLHKLEISLGGLPILNSPFRIPVAPSISQGESLLQIMPGFQHPWGVATSTNGDIVVLAEKSSHCIHVLKSNGRKVKTIGMKGKDDGNFTDPRGVAITPTNHILVTDYNRMQKLTLSGSCVRSICGKGSGPLQFQEPKGLTVHPINGKIYIADSGNNRIQVLNSDCTFSHSFGRGVLRFPWDVSCDKEGLVYVVDNETHTINKFTPEGRFLMKFGSKGPGEGKLNWPSSITCNPVDGHFYVTDDNQRISVFTNQGEYVRKIELQGQDSFNHPLGIAINGLGKIYVSDCWNNRLIII